MKAITASRIFFFFSAFCGALAYLQFEQGSIGWCAWFMFLAGYEYRQSVIYKRMATA